MYSLNDILKNSLGQGVLSRKPQQLEQKSYTTSSITLSSEQKITKPKVKKPRIAIDPVPKEKYFKYTVNEFMRLGELHKECLNMFLEISSVNKHVYPAMETIAQRLGISVRHTYTIIMELQKEGFIKKERRPYTSNVYRISSFFKRPEVKRELSEIFFAFKKFVYVSTLSASLLVSTLVQSCRANFQDHFRQETILKKNIYLNNNNTLIVSNVTQKKDEIMMLKNDDDDKIDLYKKYERPKPITPYKKYQQPQPKPVRIPARQTYVHEAIVIDTAVQKAQTLCKAIRDFKPSFVFPTLKEKVKFIVKGEYRLTGEVEEAKAVDFLEKKKKEYDL